MTQQGDPNTRQVGGDHYAQGGKLQHWDLIEEYGIGYLEGCATKYIARHRLKNGVEDLRKADHYVEKLGSMPYRKPRGRATVEAIGAFCTRHDLTERESYCLQVLCGAWKKQELPSVREAIQELINEYGAQSSEPQNQ